MQSANLREDISSGLKIINDFVYQVTDEYLNDNEQAIICGSLQGLTYETMQQEYILLKYYTSQYVSRNLAFDLWRKLTSIAQDSQLSTPDYRVKKKQIWHFVDQINQLQGEVNSKPIIIPPIILEEKILCDRYKVEEHLFDYDDGESQFRAIDLHLDNKPCLVIQRSNQTPRIRQQFKREGENLSRIGRHSQIPELKAYFTEKQHLYLVYEYISGTALTELLTGKPWQESSVKSLLISLLTVLEFIQQHNLNHRNINPDNIIQVDNNWVLIDFACVKEINHAYKSITQSTINTISQGMKGYVAPEQHTGMATFASDIYAVGMIAVQALTGIHPRQLRKYNPQTGNKIWRNQAQVSNALGDMIDRAINYHFCDRYQSAKEMLKNLKSLPRV